jgi:hypothetical protein
LMWVCLFDTRLIFPSKLTSHFRFPLVCLL